MTPSILALDPGTTQTGWCWYERGKVLESGVTENARLLHNLRGDVLAIEMVESYGMSVGREVFETVRWIGRFQQAWHTPEEVVLVPRREVKMHLCGSMRAKDANIRTALIDKLGPVGTKKNPGPLYGLKSHAWSALAVAVTAAETRISRGSPVFPQEVSA